MKPVAWLARTVWFVALGATATMALFMVLPLGQVGLFDATMVALVRYLLFYWVLPFAFALFLLGYLLTPVRPLPRTRGYVWVRWGVGLALWGLGMLLLFTPIVLVWEEALRLAARGSTLAYWRMVAWRIYILHSAFFVAGLLSLFAARKWFVRSAPHA